MLQNVYIVSDGTGLTAKQSLTSALVQFEFIDIVSHVRPNVRSEQQVLDVIKEAEDVKGIIIHTLVSRDMRHFILKKGRLFNLRTIDLMGPLLAQLSHHFEDTPSEKPGIFHKLNKAYFQRIEAIEFALRHDDGQHVEELDKANIVLLGVSRTFKTPLSVYMSYKGWKIANVPIVYGIPIPEIIFKLPSKRIFCLTTFPSKLARLRKTRDKHLGGMTGDYASPLFVQKELNYASRIYRMHPEWTIINVANKPIEEISSEIRGHIKNKGGIT